MRITIELRRPARRSVALVVGALLLLTPAVALAGHQFPDVKDTTPFHKEIGAIAKAGITGGFSDGGYHPAEAVSRQAMAAFMERGFGRVGVVGGDIPLTPGVAVAAGKMTGDPAIVRKLQITVPGANNKFTPNQLVLLNGRVTFYTTMSAAKGCPCMFGAYFQDATKSYALATQYDTFLVDSPQPFAYSFEVQALVPAAPGVHTYELWVGLVERSDKTNDAKFDLHGASALTAQTFPFGPSGDNRP